MLSSSESIAVSVALAFLNAILHYVLYRVAVALILFVKSILFWFLTSSGSLVRPKTCANSKKDERRRSDSLAKDNIDFESDYAADG